MARRPSDLACRHNCEVLPLPARGALVGQCPEVLPGDRRLHASVALIGEVEVFGDDVKGTGFVPAACDPVALARLWVQTYHLLRLRGVTEITF